MIERTYSRAELEEAYMAGSRKSLEYARKFFKNLTVESLPEMTSLMHDWLSGHAWGTIVPKKR